MFGLAVATGMLVAAAEETNNMAKRTPAYADPARFENEIKAFEAADRTNRPPAGTIVVAGSSTIRMWRGDMASDLAPLTVIPRGFGGSTVNDLLHYASRVIVPYKPRAVVLYEGDNDIGAGIPPAMVATKFESLIALLHQELPRARIYCLAVKPSPSRWALWPKMVKLNAAMQALCERDPLLTYVDVATPMLDADGQPRASLYKADKLHMTRKGYDVWTRVIRPALLEKEGAFETTPGAAR